jgi:hypothetical protein
MCTNGTRDWPRPAVADSQGRLQTVTGPFMSLASYVVTQRGARYLVDHLMPIEVQLDGAVGFLAADVAAHEPTRFVAATSPPVTVSAQVSRLTDIQNLCIKCLLPANASPYVVVLGVFLAVVVLAAALLWLWRRCVGTCHA